MIYCVYKIDVKWNESKSKIESQIHERKKIGNLKNSKRKIESHKQNLSAQIQLNINVQS